MAAEPTLALPRLQEYDVPAGTHPHDVAPAVDGGVWYTAQSVGALGYLDPATGETRHIPLGSGSAPHGVIVGPDGAPWITDSGLNAIVRVDPLTEAVDVYPLPASAARANLNTAAFDADGKLGTKEEAGPVVVTVFDKDRLADYQRMVSALRSANIRAELYLGNPRNFGNQLKYADRRKAPCVVIQGGDEKAKGEIQIKDLIEGAKAAAAIASNQEWRETRPAQFSCKESELVAKVREVLARHGLT